MSDSEKKTSTETSTAEKCGSFDWDTIARDSGSGQGRAVPVPMQANLPPTPPNTALIAGRLPIKCDTGRAVIQLPEKIQKAHCALVLPNTGVLSDCYRPAKNVCLPNALRARPINDREFEVILDGGEGVVKGLGWTRDGDYPGALLKTRAIETGVPYVEILVMVGIDCGCDSENWASENDYQ
ncbi:hypothetical protein [Streptomyces palmae]|uniref:Uncharacterized protein n=1 Tax=Streptomyces palmae TaxID=1701085 RepID=A0A4Z0H7I8_9ACTN|nr:hypothetical protein [Streptomyces palmae]TGB06798.1 hypothetical protein E4099_17940 [Streptomyces palmae]